MLFLKVNISSTYDLDLTVLYPLNKLKCLVYFYIGLSYNNFKSNVIIDLMRSVTY